MPTEIRVEKRDDTTIHLDPVQASKAPFPPGCSVVVMENSQILCSGEVTDVYVSFSHNTGSCDNSYRVSTCKESNKEFDQFVNGNCLRYAINCPVTLFLVQSKKHVKGIIKGFEVQCDDEKKANVTREAPFTYIVDTFSCYNKGDREPIRLRGVSQEHLSFCPQLPHPGNILDVEVEKPSYISSDDSLSVKEEHGSDRTEPDSPKNIVSCSSPISGRPYSTIVGSPSRESCDHPRHLKCIQMLPPIPAMFAGNLKTAQLQPVPPFCHLANYPSFSKVMLKEGLKVCVMCGETRETSKLNKISRKVYQTNDVIIVPNQNKGICTHCDVQVWIVKESGMQIKWCKGCKNFQTWALFGDKGNATKCIRCRTKQREKYAANKSISGESNNSLKRKLTPDD